MILWRSGTISILFSFHGEGYVGLCALWEGKVCFFVYVYSYCLSANKSKLWSELIEKKNLLGCVEWFIGGDFNSGERSNRSGISCFKEMHDFSEFINNLGL